jgi:DNA-binding NtrC family response regulator
MQTIVGVDCGLSGAIAWLSSEGHLIEARDLPLGADVGAAARLTPAQSLTLAELERRHIESVLHRASWHQGRAAELLGISAKTLYRKIREYGFRRPDRDGESTP